MVRRTGKGEYTVQFTCTAWQLIPGTGKWTLPGFGQWKRVSARAHRPRSSVVLSGIPVAMTEEAVRKELSTASWAKSNKKDYQEIRVERLNRKISTKSEPSTSSTSAQKSRQWAPSTSIRVFASQALCEAILQDGGAVVGFTFHPARLFEPATRRCYRCGQIGFHSARFCRSAPRCRQCGKEHETIACPHRHPDTNRRNRSSSRGRAAGMP